MPRRFLQEVSETIIFSSFFDFFLVLRLFLVYLTSFHFAQHQSAHDRGVQNFLTITHIY